MPPNNRKQAMLPDHRRGDRQPDRHRLRLRGRHRPGALLLHARRAARAAPHARGADHPAPARQERRCRRRSSSSASTPTASASRTSTRCSPAWRTLVPDGSVKLGFRAHYPQLETKLTVRGARHGRHPPQARAGRARGAQARSATSSWPRTTRRSRASCWRSWPGARRARSRWSRRSRAGRSRARIAHLPGAEKVFRRGIVARATCRGVRRRSASPAPRRTAR